MKRQELVEKVSAMNQAGYSVDEIAKALDISMAEVVKILKNK